MRKRTAALIPSFNEARYIGAIVEQLKHEVPAVYVVDDGSEDDTAAIARARGAIVISNPVNRGKGASLREGFSRILKDGFDYVLILDGDGQHQAEDIDRFFGKMEESGAGIVIGNRMRDKKAMPFIRVAVNTFMSFVISRISGQDIPDTQCGFRLIKRQVLENLRLESANYEMESELLIKASARGWKIASTPILTVYDGEKSRIDPVKDTVRFLRLILRLRFKEEGPR